MFISKNMRELRRFMINDYDIDYNTQKKMNQGQINDGLSI